MAGHRFAVVDAHSKSVGWIVSLQPAPPMAFFRATTNPSAPPRSFASGDVMHLGTYQPKARHHDKGGARKHLRSLCSVPLTLRHLLPGGITTSRGITLDLSQGGLAAVVQDPLRIGETVEIDLKLSSGPLNAVAVVRHTSLSRSGFEFVGLTPAERHMIASHNPRLDG